VGVYFPRESGLLGVRPCAHDGDLAGCTTLDAFCIRKQIEKGWDEESGEIFEIGSDRIESKLDCG